MFCPKCGNANQKPETFCRQCGTFLPDFDKLIKRETPPEEHLKANAVLSWMTAIVSFILAIMLYAVFLGREDTPVIVGITAGFLTAIFAWQVQTLWRTSKLKKQIVRKPDRPDKAESEKAFEATPTKELLNEADLNDAVPASVTEHTTKHLREKLRGPS